jgi:Fe2+ or Zn2+ uptake regulation protein
MVLVYDTVTVFKNVEIVVLLTQDGKSRYHHNMSQHQNVAGSLKQVDVGDDSV